jgi:hypothetical protein
MAIILAAAVVAAMYIEGKFVAFMSEGSAIHDYHGICNVGVGQPYEEFIHQLRTIAESGDTNRLLTVLRRADEHSRDIYEVWLDDLRHDSYRESIQEILKPLDPAQSKQFSGAAWWHANQAKYPNSTKVEDLEPAFRAKVNAFLGALADAGIHPNIESTLRSKQRAYVMHYCWDIAHGKILPSEVPPYRGIDIVWDHGEAAKSKKAAQNMVDLFEMDYMASLTSNHINGLAIDMKFSWTGTLKIKKKDGTVVEIKTTPRNGADNTQMHEVGASYGVIKLVGDAPHWSVDGR